MPRLLIVFDVSSPNPEERITEQLRLDGIFGAAHEAGFGAEEICYPKTWDEALALQTHVPPFDFAIVDIALWGELEGGVHYIRELYIQQPACRIIAITGQRGTDALDRALLAGAVNFVNIQRNPVWEKDLRDQLKEARDAAIGDRLAPLHSENLISPFSPSPH